MRRPGISRCLFLFAILVAPGADALELGPPIPGSWTEFPVVGDGTSSFRTRFDFQLASTEEDYTPDGLLDTFRAPNDRYLSCSWPIAEPDRDDRFSARWKGRWKPGEREGEVRLRSEGGEARFYLNGKETLRAGKEFFETTASVSLDARRHDLRLDYRHNTGAAAVSLDWRDEEGPWKPWGLEGPWEGTFYLGANFEEEGYSRADPAIAFDWNEGGPFNRPEDVPAAKLEWANPGKGERDSGVFGAFSVNRPGHLNLVFEATPSIQFDRTPVVQLGDVGSSTRTFEMRAGDRIHFWEQGTRVQTGAAARAELDRRKTAFEASRVRLAGDAAPHDRALASAGWWLNAFLAEGGEAENTSPMPAGLPEAVSALAVLTAPDLLSPKDDFDRRVEEAWRRRGWSRDSEAERSSIKTAVSGMTDALESLSHLETFARPEEAGGWELGNLEPIGRLVVENLPLFGKRYTFEAGPSGTRLVEGKEGSGLFLSLSGPAVLSDLRFREKGKGRGMTARISMTRPGLALEIGPIEKIETARWNGNPILLVHHGKRFRAPALPGKKGTLEIRFGSSGLPIPRE